MEPLNISMVLKRPLKICNGFWRKHHHWMFFGSLTIANNVFQWILVLLPSLSMVFNDFGPLVKQCNGFDGSSWSILKFNQFKWDGKLLPCTQWQYVSFHIVAICWCQIFLFWNSISSKEAANYCLAQSGNCCLAHSGSMFPCTAWQYVSLHTVAICCLAPSGNMLMSPVAVWLLLTK